MKNLVNWKLKYLIKNKREAHKRSESSSTIIVDEKMKELKLVERFFIIF